MYGMTHNQDLIALPNKMRLRKFYLLCLMAISGLMFLFFWIYMAVDSLPRQRLPADTSLKNSILFESNSPVRKKSLREGNAKTNKTKPAVQNVIDLPKDLNSVDLSGWEISVGENLEKNGADYLNDEKPTPGLTFRDQVFYLNGMRFQIFSGAIHYFRIVPEYWLDRLKKMKACGINTIETYVPWNLHEPSPGVFDFEGMLNLRKFLMMAAEMGLYVILRPGPYICSEFEFGGLPGWLLTDPTIKLRTNHRGYINSVNKYWSVLLPLVLDLQFTDGGPIIMFQVENEYASFAADSNHVRLLLYLFRQYGVKELVATSDNGFGAYKDPEFDLSKFALETMNGNKISTDQLEVIQHRNKHSPMLVMELWCGWFDQWGQKSHETKEIAPLDEMLTYIMDHGGSFNLYMFHGGTNFGFTSGATNLSNYRLVTTSYDYDAPLTEAGDATPKYFFIRNLLLKFYAKIGIPYLPEVPPNTPKGNYGNLKVMEIMDWNSFLYVIPMLDQRRELDYMENYRDRSGHYHTLGYIVYSLFLRPGVKWDRKIGPHLIGYAQGRLNAILNGETFYAGSDFAPVAEDEFLWDKPAQAVTQGVEKVNASARLQVDLMVENQGRVNYVNMRSSNFDTQRRGVKGPILKTVFGIKQEEWSVRILDFSKQQIQTISQSRSWVTVKAYSRHLEDTGQTQKPGPMLYRTYLNVQGSPKDTYIRLKDWSKGIVIVNGFNLGRYWHVGPQKTLYLPAPLLRQGKNEFIIFEEHRRGPYITLQDFPELG